MNNLWIINLVISTILLRLVKANDCEKHLDLLLKSLESNQQWSKTSKFEINFTRNKFVKTLAKT
jgi:hypothetical protein